MIHNYSKILQLLIDQIENLQINIPNNLPFIVEKIAATTNNVICIGVGKSGYIAQKMSATLASIGVVSFYLHPTEAIHGDLGRIRSGDICIFFSHSGNSTELIPVLNYCNQYLLPATLGEPSLKKLCIL
jgi:arabinose-5-phosphate isomerase